MSVNSVPWSEVWIDGKNTGKHTPFVDVEIGCGEHRIDFKRPDLQIAESESIVVKPGQPFKRRYTLPGGGAEVGTRAAGERLAPPALDRSGQHRAVAARRIRAR